MMSRQEKDQRLEDAKAIPMAEVVSRLGLSGLKRAGASESIGPCPMCGGKDRFGVNTSRGVWNCRHCGGGDALSLVQHVLGCDFAAALSWLVGEADVQMDPVEAKRREEARAKASAAAAKRAQAERRKSIDAARKIWQEGQPTQGTLVEAYLERRGLPRDIATRRFASLRYHPDLPFTVPADSGGGWQTIHRGPAILAACQAPSGILTAVHRTWLDLDQSKGKAVIFHRGEQQPSKKILGSKKGAAIRLTHVRDFPSVLVMGEGIETTLTALAASAWSDAGYWAGIDLGNMSGARILRGTGMKYAGIPDLEDMDAFRPPPQISELIFLQDGDSDPALTRAKLLSGLRRAKHYSPHLRIGIAHAGEGRDFNDILTSEASNV